VLASGLKIRSLTLELENIAWVATVSDEFEAAAENSVFLTSAEGIFAGAALDVCEVNGVTELERLSRVEMLMTTVVDM
jgi:hypothetical protein